MKTPITTLNISLPQTLKSYVEERVSKKGYSSASEYFRELVRGDQEREARERLEALLLEGLRSGRTKTITKRDLDAIRKKARSNVKSQPR
jgi:antitoxin ParD1/3/4